MKRFFTFILLIAITGAAFAATMDAKVRTVPKETQELVFKKPKEGLPAVVKHLTTGAGSTSAKVKVLHDWICDNIAYDTDVFTVGVRRQDYETVLKKQKAICAGYANLMNEMCRLAGVECIRISGHSKGVGYKGALGKKPDHDWNAVNLSGKWQLIDVTWDAGLVDFTTFVKRYSTQWLYLTPEQFIFSHLPEDDKYQYLKEPKTPEQFVKEPYVPGIFFEYGLAFASVKTMPDYTNRLTETVQYEFKATRSNVSVMSDLYDKAGNTGVINNATWIDKTAGKLVARYDVPNAQLYRGRLLARNRNETKNPTFISIAEYEGSILPQAQQLVAEKKVTQKEYEYLEQSYSKVVENGRYYIIEDLFDSPRNTAVTKILKLEEENSNFEEVLYFELQAADGYTGFGSDALRFPTPYTAFIDATNTSLVTPAVGTLQKGSSQNFVIETKDFTSVGVVIDGGIVSAQKDAKGAFELTVTVPSDTDALAVYGSKNGKNFSGLWTYQIE